MPIRVVLNHRTRYAYDRPISMSPHIVRLRPAPHCRTPIRAYSLRIKPQEHFINWQQDPYSNYQARLVFPEKATELSVEVDLVAEMTVINPFDFFVESAAEKYPFAYDPVLQRELGPYLERCKPGPLLRKLIDSFPRKDIRTIDFLVDINRQVNHAVKYLIRMEPGVQTPEETLTLRSGSCRDSAWLMVQLLRHLGLASRFVSGYLIQLTADVKSLDGPAGPASDFTDLHAWTEVFIPGAGWVGLDPTSGLLAAEGHIPLACTADPSSAAPITGAVDECKVDFSFQMSVTRVHEDPRVTKPYTEDQWNEIEALGHRIDEILEQNDVRMTMGGEPTFVSIDDMEGDEWNTAALGPMKRQLAGRLVKRLRDRFAPGGLLHYGQGKWYPGESLPRWALGCYWRRDGIPVWEDIQWLAEPDAAIGHDSDQAGRFVQALARRLAVPDKFIIPAYEDTWYYLWKERRLPVNVDPLNNKLENEEDRKRFAKVFEQGLAKIVGYALPLRPTGDPGAPWQSGVWHMRPERMYLLPGDSPMGFRLPLDSLAWVAPSEYPHLYELDPMVPRPPLDDPRRPRQLTMPAQPAPANRAGMHRGQYGQMGNMPQLDRSALEWDQSAPDRVPGPGQSAPWIIRTALCIEPRNGVLHVFMPPQRRLEDYLQLVASIEQTAADTRLPVVIEGYTPPHDPRINVIKVTPDPGVIEVNIHPAHNWKELVQNTTGLYEDAHFSRLGTEKFMLDGRHTGTGGGNHVVIGGAVPADSPFLRRPDLLKSLVAYWHNHPSLSYLFSSMFIGPTSQAPRADEGRPDMVYELELAMKQIPDIAAQAKLPPWIIDRVLRNLLVDLTGNTHRAEFCIDKLYSPDSAAGRLGLVEFRGFEMPPHARMSLTQQLLLRAMVARFWKSPYERPLVRWGTELHDRFMLPHFVAEDFNDVLLDMNAAAFNLQPEWFAPHHEFRFPLLGQLDSDGIHIELRQAIEPWYVLGEEPGAGGTARYVDSSLERLQIKVQGMVHPRHAVACNGMALPLHPTGRNGEFVAGVRFRAWQPPSCLHPTIPVNTPLVFDIVDLWNDRAIAGCTYHASHPGGRSFDQFPVNAFEAESRRVARFFKYGHTPGPTTLQFPEKSREFPFTLDLRQA